MIDDQNAIIRAENTRPDPDELTPTVIANAEQYIAMLTEKRDLVQSHNREDVLVEMDL